MANTKKSSGRKNTGSGKKAAETRRKNQERMQRKQTVTTEIYLWVGVALSILLFLSNFGVIGIVGKALSNVMLGLFGTMGYIFPIVLAVVVFLIAYSKSHDGVTSKIVGTIMAYIDICLLFNLMSYGSGEGDKVFDYYKLGSESDFGGGIVGGALSKLFNMLIGLVGSYILGIVVLMITVVILTEKSIMDGIKSKGQDAYDEAREARIAARERRREAEFDDIEEIEDSRVKPRRGRNSNRGKGINFGGATVGDGSEQKSDIPSTDNIQEVHEIHFEGLDDEPVDVPVDDTTYTFEVDEIGKQTKFAGMDQPKETPKADEHATDGEFTPKERVYVPESAMDAMKRGAYGTTSQASENDSSEDQEQVTMKPKRESSHGEIITPKKRKVVYKKPPMSLLKDASAGKNSVTKASLTETANKLKTVLANFGVNVEVTNVSKGPSVTRYELQPEMGTKVSRITGLADDIKLNMAAADIRIEAPIPGKAAVGIEIPNEGRDSVCLKELLLSKEFRPVESKLAFPAGKDISGQVVVGDIAKMPHMLIAGTTGSGKSVFTNSILMSILYRTTPEEVRVMIIDPKVVEFQVYNGIPHLLHDVITDPKKAAGALNWAVAEMTNRYKKFADAKVRDIKSFNAKVERGEFPKEDNVEKMPQILIIIDELADLMMVAAKEVEEAICRLAQLARAAGIHMAIATQRPSVDVITGLIKANVPSRVALTVASGTDSRTIIDMNGAEKLLGKGDMLFYPSGEIKPVRLQGAFVEDSEIAATVEFIKNSCGEVEYDSDIDTKMEAGADTGSGSDGERDAFFAEAGRMCIEQQKGSTSMIQRRLKVGFNRAARIMEQLYDAGVVGAEETNKPRKVIMTMEEFENLLNN